MYGIKMYTINNMLYCLSIAEMNKYMRLTHLKYEFNNMMPWTDSVLHALNWKAKKRSAYI